MSDKKPKVTTSKVSSTQKKTKPQTEEVTISEPLQEIEEPQPEPVKETVMATGLEDYGRWKTMFKDHKRKGKPPFPRRGRIWA